MSMPICSSAVTGSACAFGSSWPNPAAAMIFYSHVSTATQEEGWRICYVQRYSSETPLVEHFKDATFEA
jgi:hypothetical protein